ncbi:MAG TPA: autotransporter-associated beta strand repeat-containing protein, partial [Tepidisphaeraceae bacterium]
IINGGILAITSDLAVNSGTGGVSFGGGVLQFNNYSSSLNFSSVSSLNLGAATGGASTLTGTISGSYGLTYSGPGTLILAGANSYQGNTSVSAGTLEYDITSGSVSVGSSATVTIDSGAALVADGTVDPFSYTSGGATYRVGIINNSTVGGAGFSVTNGTKSIGTLTGSGATTVGTATTSATLDAATFAQNSVSLVNSSVLQVRKRSGSEPQINTVTSLSIDSTSTLKLRDNALVVDYGSSGTDPATTIQSLITSGSNGGVWNGPGITGASRTATSLGYADINNGEDVRVSGNWLGQAVDTYSVVVAFTWLGDLNLDGVVDSTDLGLMGLPGTADWYHGDLNYDGKVNADDWSLFELGAEFYSIYGAWPDDTTSSDDAVMGSAILSSAEAEFSGETNDEIKSQLESQMAPAMSVVALPEPIGNIVIIGISTLLVRRRNRHPSAQRPAI